jgi:hypothetical protein
MEMREILNLLESTTYRKGDPIGRWAFLYLEPLTPEQSGDFAQCSSCSLFLPGKKRCAVFGPDDVVKANASCGLYISGKPKDDQRITSSITPVEAGYVEGQVRCENCSWYKDGTCDLYAQLDQAMPDTFRLGSTVSPKGCCNAWG